MKVNKQREEIPNKLKQMSAQIDEMKMLTVKSSLKEQHETRIKQMDKIMEEARTEFDQADQSGKKDWSGFDQKIFRNLESFNRAYRKAGAMFGGSPERSSTVVHPFNNLITVKDFAIFPSLNKTASRRLNYHGRYY